MSAPTASPRHRQRSYSTVLLLLLFVLSLVCVGIAGQLHAAVPASGSPALVDDGQPQPLPAEGKGLAIEAAGEAGSAHEDNDSPRGLPPPRALLAPNHCNAGMRPCLAGFPVSDPRLRLNPGNGPPLA
ncbi:MAG: hypothetical protein ACI4NW_11995 [Stenotrophomonas sp.]